MKPILQKHTSTFRYGPKQIPFHFWSQTNKGTTAIDTIIFLGSGQTGRITKWVAANAPAGTVVVEGLPHKEADKSAHDLKEFAHEYTETAFSAVLKTFGISSAHIVAESQAGPGAIWMALDHTDQVKNVTLIAPLGFTAHILGNSPKERLRELKRRGFLSSMQRAQSPLYDLRNIYLSALVFQVVLFDARWEASGQKYAVGSSYDIREDCRKLVDRLHKQGKTFTLILGEYDKLFPPKEVIASLEKSNVKCVTTIILKTSHASLAIRDGKHILSRAINAVRQEAPGSEMTYPVRSKTGIA